ncbi:MAG: tRNA lysidine(34) synthetase TilS [Alphaproteobacteria bacterium]
MSANKKIAVGVSGGADSLALALMLKEKGLNIIALTVNHGLRKEAKKEALYVKKTMKDNDIEHHTLEWKGAKPKTAIEEKAREARYNLMINWCKKNNINDLYLAHHKNDQAETFLMRLIRGSGIDGLASMQEETQRDDINIIRPLLNTSKEELEAYLKKKKIKWVKDKMNFDDTYLRSKLRKLLPKLEKSIGLTTDRIILCANNMARAKDYFNKEVDGFFNNNVKFEEEHLIINKAAFLDLHPEMGLRVLVKALSEVNGKIYKPRLVSLESVYNKIINEKKFNRYSLSHCIIEFRKQGILIKKER